MSILSTDVPALPWGMGFAALAGLAAIVLFGIRRFKGGARPRRSTFVWSGVFSALLLFIAVMCFAGMCIVEFWIYLIYVGVMTLFGVLVLYREGILRKILTARGEARADAEVQSASICPNVSFIRNPVRIFVLIALASFAAMVALEIADNDVLFLMWPETFWFAYLLCAFIVAGLYFLGQRRGGAPAVGIVLFCLIGIAENFVDRFKNATITPNDLSALGTAMEVGAGYRFDLGTSIFISIMVAAAGIFLCAFMAPSGRRAEKPLAQLGINVVAGALALTGFGLCISVPNHAEVFSITPYYWDLRFTYRYKGFLLSFATLVQDMEAKPPAGYTVEGAEELEAELVAEYKETFGADPASAKARAQFEAVRPNVVTIMNESYSDLSILDGLHAGYKGPTYTRENPADALFRGAAFVSTYGGGTCNSEFEYLTGASMAYLGTGKYPYVQYNFANVDCLPKIMKRSGYGTTAIHPHTKTNWNRDIAYPAMGFDEFLDLESFQGAPTYHHPDTATDGATYDMALDVLRKSAEPQFIMDITLQNHGGYDTGNIPVAERLDYTPDALGTAEKEQLNEYLACIEASDRDLEKFIGELRAFEEPTAVVFFGDHQPGVDFAYNDAFYPDEDPVDHFARLNQTVYFIWANYEVDGFADAAPLLAGAAADGALPKDAAIETKTVTVNGETLMTVTARRDTSLNFLGALALQTIGAPLSDFQKASLTIMRDLPVVCGNGYRDASGTWYALDSEEDTPSKRLFDKLGMIQYLNFNERLH